MNPYLTERLAADRRNELIRAAEAWHFAHSAERRARRHFHWWTLLPWRTLGVDSCGPQSPSIQLPGEPTDAVDVSPLHQSKGACTDLNGCMTLESSQFDPSPS